MNHHFKTRKAVTSKALTLIILFSFFQCSIEKNRIYFNNELNALGVCIDSCMYLINEKDWMVNKFYLIEGDSAKIAEPSNVRLLEDCHGFLIRPIKINKSESQLQIISSTECLNKNLFANNTITILKKFNYCINWDSIRIISPFCDSDKIFKFTEIYDYKYMRESQFGHSYPFTVKDEINILVGTNGKLIYRPDMYFDKSHAIPIMLEIFYKGKLLGSYEYDINFNFWLMSINELFVEYCKTEI